MNKVFSALAHPVRRHILKLLKAHDALSAGELAGHFDVSKPTLSHHLKLLAEAELLDRERRGQFIYYSITLSVFEEASQVLMDLFDVGGAKVPVAPVGAAQEGAE